MFRWPLKFVFGLLIFCSNVYCQSTDYTYDSWEKGEVIQASPFILSEPGSNPLISGMQTLIHLYQSKAAPNSISRCPFAISCSRYADRALEKYGVFGIPVFVDRFFYRENNELFGLYPKVFVKYKPRYDDSFYLTGAFKPKD